MTMGREFSGARTEPGSTLEFGAEEFAAERAEGESFELADPFGSFAPTESIGNKSIIAKTAPQNLSTDARPPRIQ